MYCLAACIVLRVVGGAILFALRRCWRKICTILQPMESKSWYLKKCPKPCWPLRSKESWIKYTPQIFFNIWWPMPLFWIFFISQICNEIRTFYIQLFCLGIAWLCGPEVVWRLACFGAAVTCLWLGLKSACAIFLMGIDSADTNQPPNGEICMDKSHLLPTDPVRQYRYTSVPIEAALYQ